MAHRVLFINGGILGLVSFHNFLLRHLPGQSAIEGEHILLTAGLTLPERIARRALAQRLWKDGLLGTANLDLVRFRLELFAGLQARGRIARLGAHRFDVLHFHRQATAYGSLDLMKRVPSIVSIDCTQECVVQQAPGALERATYRLNLGVDGAVFRRAAAIIATSAWAARSLQHYYPDCTTPVHVMPNPVLLEFFDPGWIDMRRSRAAAGRLPRLLFIGGDFPRKGGYDLLEAWQAGSFHTRAALDIVSDWHLDRPLPPGVTVHSGVRAHTPEWSARWAAADVFVLPTRNEAFGLVYQEAAAAGLPAIGTRENAVPEIIADGQTGLLVDAGDRAGLAAAMDTLIGSPDMRDTFGRRARAFIEESACPDKYMEQMTDVVTHVARRP